MISTLICSDRVENFDQLFNSMKEKNIYQCPKTNKTGLQTVTLSSLQTTTM